MALDLLTYRSAVMSHAQALGLFGNVLGHEPVSAPPSGLTCAVWVSRVAPVPAGSGVAAGTGRLELMARVFMPADTDPEDSVDIAVTDAVDQMLSALFADFTLGDTIRNVDLLGAHGTALSAVFAYTGFGGGTTYRIATLTIPLIINDLWTEAP